jgi:amidase
MSWDTFGTEAPMAGSVRDLALAMDVLSGPDPSVPLSSHEPEGFLRAAVNGLREKVRVAVSVNLGITDVEPEIEKAIREAANRCAPYASVLEESSPNWVEGERVVNVYRCLRLATKHGPLLPQYRDQFQPAFLENIEQGLALTGSEIAEADRLRNGLIRAAADFFKNYDVLISATTPVLPFPFTTHYPETIAGRQVRNYISWLLLTYVPAVVGVPAIALPVGLSSGGLPFGIQLIGPWRSEGLLFRLAASLEAEFSTSFNRKLVEKELATEPT